MRRRRRRGSWSGDGRGFADRRDFGRQVLSFTARVAPLPHGAARELRVSRNTVKTQAISVYRKLGVSSRSAAIGQASELGLLEPPTAMGIRTG